MTLLAARALWWAVALAGGAAYLAALPASHDLLVTGEHGAVAPASMVSAGLAEVGWSRETYAAMVLTLLVTYTVVAAGAAVLVHARCRRDVPALLVSAVLLAHAWGWPQVLDSLGGRWPWYDALAGAVTAFGFAGFFCLPFVFPDGRFVPGWTRWFALVLVAETTAASAGLSPVALLPPAAEEVAESVLGLVVLGAVVLATVHRYRTVSTPEQRRQTRGVAVALLGLTSTFVLLGVLGPVLERPGPVGLWLDLVRTAVLTLGFAVLPLAVAAAVLRRGLWGAPRVLRRALALAAVVTVLLLLYALVVGSVTWWVGARGHPLATVAGALTVALAVEPLRRAATRWASRVTLGDRGDAAAAVQRLSRRLEAAVAPADVLPAALSAVLEAVRAPGVAVRGTGVDAGCGPDPDLATAWVAPLVHQGEVLGELVVARRDGDGYDARERRLLADLCGPVSLAVHAVRQQTAAARLARDLQRSRRRLVTAREEERRRLRRDLHDGLGPALAGQVLRVEAARDLAGRDDARVRELLDRAVAEAVHAVSEVRRVVDDLRPPALDGGGLEAAVRQEAARLAEGTEIRTPTHGLPALPAAVEVAALHIVAEALTNAARHAPGAPARVVLGTQDAALRVEVEDDGPGLPAAVPAGGRRGAGLSTMRERAEELGGTLGVGPGRAGGTRVVAVLPTTPAAGQESETADGAVEARAAWAG